MLFQSDETNLYLLPALPVKAWRDGLVAGLRGRGAVTVGIRWLGGKLEEVTIQVCKFIVDTEVDYWRVKSRLSSSLCNFNFTNVHSMDSLELIALGTQQQILNILLHFGGSIDILTGKPDS